MLDALNSFGKAEFQFPSSQCKRVSVFTRFSRKFLQPKHEDERTSIRRLRLPSRPEVLLAAVHLPSKLFWSEDSQAFECSHLARTISAVEDKIGHRRTVLVGDFNMNPFETGVVAAGGLNAVMSKTTAARSTRMVQGREYRFFYNPMWAHFGDARGNAAGTYYYDGSEHVNYFWNVFDQVLIRPDLMAGFDFEQMRILTKIGSRSLTTTDGRPDSVSSSDHLPILFDLDF